MIKGLTQREKSILLYGIGVGMKISNPGVDAFIITKTLIFGDDSSGNEWRAIETLLNDQMISLGLLGRLYDA